MSISSKNVKVYPSAYRGQIEVNNKKYVFDPESRLNTETNITRPFRQLATYGDGSFVISKSKNTDGTFNIEFMCKGYYFNIKNFEFTTPNIKYYAHINIMAKGAVDDSDNTKYAAFSLSPLNNTKNDDILDNDNEEFLGLIIDTNSVNGSASGFELGTFNGNDFVIAETSQIKIKETEVYGGEQKEIDEYSDLTSSWAGRHNLSNYLETENAYITETLIVPEIGVNEIHGKKIVSNTTLNIDAKNFSVNNQDSAGFIKVDSNGSGSFKTNSTINIDSNIVNIGDVSSTTNPSFTVNKANKALSKVEAKIGGTSATLLSNELNLKTGHCNISLSDTSPEIILKLVDNEDRQVKLSADSVTFGSDECVVIKNADEAHVKGHGSTLDYKGSIVTNGGIYVKSNIIADSTIEATESISSATKLRAPALELITILADTDPINFKVISHTSYCTSELRLGLHSMIYTNKTDDEDQIVFKPNATEKDLDAFNIYWNSTKQKVGFGFDAEEVIFGSNTATTFDNTGTSLTAKGQIQAQSFYATSDKRLKENIVEWAPEKSILDLPIYKYDYIKSAKNQIGCLAQDLQEICPELVRKDAAGYLTIQESKIVYLLLDEVKKLKKEVEELKK